MSGHVQKGICTGEQLCYIHIPKTGGNTLTAIIESHFDRSEICALPTWSEIPDASPGDLGRYKLIRGHVYYDICKLLPSLPAVMTMLRDPVERTLSQYAMMKRLQRDPWHETVKDMEFGEWISHPVFASLCTNTQTRYLASEFDVQTVDDIATAREDIEAVDVNVAKRRLASCRFFGLVERFDESVRLMCHAFGWEPVQEFESSNVAPADRISKQELTAEELETVHRLTVLDGELLAFARELFTLRFSQFESEISGARSGLAAYDAAQVA